MAMNQQFFKFLQEQKRKILSEKIRLEKYKLENVKDNNETKEGYENSKSQADKLIKLGSDGECFDTNILNSKFQNSCASNKDEDINNLSANLLETNIENDLENKLKYNSISPRERYPINILRENSKRGGDMPTNDYMGLSFLGSEYEQKKKQLLQARQLEYKEYVEQQKMIEELSKNKRSRRVATRFLFLDDKPDAKMPSIDGAYNFSSISKGVQTEPFNCLMPGVNSSNTFDSPNITNSDVSRESILNGGLPRSLGIQTISETGTAGDKVSVYVDRINIENQHNIVDHSRTNASPRTTLLNQLKSSYYPSFVDSFETPEMRNLRRAQEQAYKREIYQAELRQQIKEKQKMIEAQKAREEEEDRALARRYEEQVNAIKLEKEREIQQQRKRLDEIRKTSEERKVQFEIEDTSNKLYRNGYRRRQQLAESNDIPDTSCDKSNLKSERPISPPIPTFRNKPKPPFSTNIEDDSIFSKSINGNLGDLSDQVKNLEKFEVDKYHFPPHKAISFKHFENDYKQIVDDWKSDIVRDFDEESVDSGLSEPVNDIYIKRPIRVKNRMDTCRNRTKSEMKPSTEKISLSRKPSRPAHVTKGPKSDNGQMEQARNILTQLGAIRKQLQLEQMRLDETITKQPNVSGNISDKRSK